MTNPITLKRTLGERLAKSRRVNAWSQQDMADKLGIGRRSIIRYEDDQSIPSIAVLIAWANVCDVPYTWLIDETYTETDLQGYLWHPSVRGRNPQVDAFNAVA